MTGIRYTGSPTKMSLFFFGDNFYKNKATFKIFSPQILEVYRILLVETTLESIMFYYTFSVINTMFVPCTEHFNTSGIISHGADSYCVKLITPNHPISKISNHLAIFWGGTWKTEFVKTIHRQERTSSEEKSDGFHKKCSIELWTILMFELLLCCHTAARCMERTQY